MVTGRRLGKGGPRVWVWGTMGVPSDQTATDLGASMAAGVMSSSGVDPGVVILILLAVVAVDYYSSRTRLCTLVGGI